MKRPETAGQARGEGRSGGLAAAIVVAGGTGSRLDPETPKQFLDLEGRPMLVHALLPFEASSRIVSIVVVLPRERIEAWNRTLIERFGLSKIEAVVAGGVRRRDSVRLGLEAAARLARRSELSLVAVHDAARPLLRRELLEELLDAAAEHGAAVPVVPVADTVVERTEGLWWEGTVDRRRLGLVQTPQVFRTDWLEEAHRLSGDADATDDAQMVRALDHPVRLVDGDPLNLKVTTSGDLELVRCVLAGGGRR